MLGSGPVKVKRAEPGEFGASVRLTTAFFPHTHLVHGGNEFWPSSLARSARLEWGSEAFLIPPLSPFLLLSKRKGVNDLVRAGLSLATFVLCSVMNCMFVGSPIS